MLVFNLMKLYKLMGALMGAGTNTNEGSHAANSNPNPFGPKKGKGASFRNFGGGGDKCLVCNKTAYVAERLVVSTLLSVTTPPCFKLAPHTIVI